MTFKKRIKWLRRNSGRIAAVLCAGGLIAFFITYKEEKKSNTVPFDFDPETVPTMVTDDVRTLISDSGYIRYHIKSPLWLMYAEAKEPNWKFPKGLFLEKYNDTMGVNATFQCDTALYLTDKKLWKFRGNVRMINDVGDKFATQLLYWDQQERKLRSDSFIHIEKGERVIEGYGFESNENITAYRVHKPSMRLPMSEFSGTPAPVGVSGVAYPAYNPANIPAAQRPDTARKSLKDIHIDPQPMELREVENK